jgi:hypothetical protein
MRSGLVGQDFWSFWPAAQVTHADAAIKTVAVSRKKDEDFMRAPEALKASLEQF